MSSRFVNPFPQFLDATPTVRSGAKLFFYAAGTSTKQNTYSDKALTIANTNPVVLNSAGYPSGDIYLQDLDYKVVLAPSTDTDPPGSPIWTADPVFARDSKLVAKTVTGSGSPSGVVAGTAGSASILPDFYWDFTGAILYVCTATGTTSTATWTAVNASTAAAVVPPPQGYLTLTTGVPIIAADVTAATSVFYTPYVGNIVPIYNGAAFTPTTFTELTLSLVASHVASNIYDVFVFNNSGVPTIVTGPSWSAGTAGSITAGSCARGTGAGGAALSRINGIYTNAVQITGRNGATTYTINANLATYVGSIFMDGTNGQITCHRSYGKTRKWGISNAYNRHLITLLAGETSASWSPATTLGPTGGSINNVATSFCGLPEESVFSIYVQATQPSYSSNTATSINAIGLNSTAAASGSFGTVAGGNASTAGNVEGIATATFTLSPGIGINNLQMLDSRTNSVTSFGGQSSCQMTTTWMG